MVKVSACRDLPICLANGLSTATFAHDIGCVEVSIRTNTVHLFNVPSAVFLLNL